NPRAQFALNNSPLFSDSDVVLSKGVGFSVHDMVVHSGIMGQFDAIMLVYNYDTNTLYVKAMSAKAALCSTTTAEKVVDKLESHHTKFVDQGFNKMDMGLIIKKSKLTPLLNSKTTIIQEPSEL